jgi:4-carboxymuconolactone decarboxylase
VEARFAVILAAVTALPLDSDQRRDEFAALVDAGCPPALAEDILIQMAAYVGYPRASQALNSYCDARREAGETAPLTAPEQQDTSPEARYQRGIEDYARLNPEALNTIQTAFSEISGDFVHLTFRAFGDVFASSGQPLVLRQLATLSALAVLGSAAPQLRFHITAALHVGVRRDQVVEVIAWTQFFAGMPAAYNALVELKAALSEGAAPAYR